MTDTRNIQDKYKAWEHDLIVSELRDNYTGIEVLMVNIEGDFNFGSVVRNANNFGAARVFYVGSKKWDKRSAVGTHHYTEVIHLGTSLEDLEEWLDIYGRGYDIIALENNVNYETVPLNEMDYGMAPQLLVVGSESEGLPELVLDRATVCVEIPSYGSVRSLNVATATGIALYDYCSKRD